MSVSEQRRRQLAKVHIAKEELGLGETEYRDLVGSVAPGKTSAADLSDRQLALLVHRCEELGWRPGRPRQRTPFPPMVWKARNLWLELHRAGAVHTPSWSALGRFAKRMTGVGNLRRLDERQAVIVIEALKKWLERVENEG